MRVTDSIGARTRGGWKRYTLRYTHPATFHIPVN
jgi:hypothetical protein